MTRVSTVETTVKNKIERCTFNFVHFVEHYASPVDGVDQIKVAPKRVVAAKHHVDVAFLYDRY